jgi:hopene-associated glycosyltransferase HpnB
MATAILILALLVAVSVLLLPWRPWSTRESLDAAPDPQADDLGDVTVLIPARNEAAVIAGSLAGLAAQGTNLRVLVIDDQSSDGTAEAARASDLRGVEVIAGQALAAGWSGKLWALEQGRRQVRTPLTLLLDADIVLKPGTLAALRRKLRQDDLDLVSLMAHLDMQSPLEKLLLPAFVYFFKLIYPFALANDPRKTTAAAAGGCILLRTETLERIGGFDAVRGALIDDCSLAAAVKTSGGRTWIGLTHSAISRRRYTAADVWNMVARTAYTQLRYSPALLAACSTLMTLYYLAPPAAMLGLLPGGAALGAATYLLAVLPYVPTLRYYRLPAVWALLLPLIAAWYLAMTWSSASRYYRGERSRWKGRVYQRSP